ncbi:MAG: NAD(P)/FAD-dependent oxidoreductase [Hyphomicrobiales bacterium]
MRRQSLMNHLEAVVIGGGQSGLATSHFLQQIGCEHVVLERARVAERWRTERWDSLHFQFPNSFVRLPGFALDAEPDRFAHYSEIVKFVEGYANKTGVPVLTDTEVTRLCKGPKPGTFSAETNHGTFTGLNVVIATGPFQKPIRPHFAEAISATVYQVDAALYRNPGELPSGNVLVVGSGASGCQIAEELYQSGRKVFLAISRHRRTPRRYKGKDILWWFEQLGRLDIPIDALPNKRPPPSTVITGIAGGHLVDVRRFARDGVSIVGHIQGATADRFSIAPNANAILDEADQSCRDFLASADALASRLGFGDVGEEEEFFCRQLVHEVVGLDLKKEGITSIIWATGYTFDYGWVELPIFSADGVPQQKRGVTALDGAFFVGLHWMYNFKSGLLPYVGEDAAFVSQQIHSRIRM